MARRATLGLVVGAVLAAALSVPSPVTAEEGPWVAPGSESSTAASRHQRRARDDAGRPDPPRAIYSPTVLGTITRHRVSSR